MSTKHTPGELERGDLGYGNVCLWGCPDDERLIAVVSNDEVENDVAEANAARIVLAWNCHDDLLAALKAALPYVYNAPFENAIDVHAQMEAAIAKATGGNQ